MKMRTRRLRYKPIWYGLNARRDWPKGKYFVLQSFLDVGHDEHNCWDEYLLARFK